MSGTVPDGAGLQTAKNSGAAVFAYGSFINAIINFLVIAFVVFLLVRAVNRIKDWATRRGEEVASAPKGPTRKEFLTDIRNLLATGRTEGAPGGIGEPAGWL